MESGRQTKLSDGSDFSCAPNPLRGAPEGGVGPNGASKNVTGVTSSRSSWFTRLHLLKVGVDFHERKKTDMELPNEVGFGMGPRSSSCL